MANEKNLKRGNPATQFHKGRGNGRGAVENAEKSHEVQRANRLKKRQVKESLSILMKMPVPDNLRTMLQKNGMEIDEETNCAEAIAYMMFLHSLKGNTKMLKMMFELTGQDPENERKEKELKLKEKAVKAYSDSTRNGQLAELIEGLKDDIHTETKSTNGEVAEK